MLQIEKVVDGCEVTIADGVKTDRICVNCGKFANQKLWIGKSVGDIVYKTNGTKYKIVKIEQQQTEESDPVLAEWKKVQKLRWGMAGRNISLIGGDLSISRKLLLKKTYGKTAHKIYDSCVSYFGFNPHKKDLFLPQQLLYAQNCTKEGYVVWMLPHSDLTGDSNGKWANFIDVENREIIEYAFVKDFIPHKNDEKRVVFAKQEDGEYVFVGVYCLKAKFDNYFSGRCRRKSIWKLVSENYPKGN